MMKRMIQETLAFIKKYHMLEPGDRVVAGLSGGADSICLLHLLWCLREELGIALFAVHVHHGLRGEEADRDARFSTEFSGRLGIPCRVERICVEEEAREAGISVEEAGRAARYRILEAEAGRISELGNPRIAAGAPGTSERRQGRGEVKIATAHHGNDSAETILYHLLRGSGLRGLSGIAPVRGRIIRPILWAEREDILAYLSEQELSYVEDSTNGENVYMRNRLRNQIIPLLRSEINEKAVQNILRAGELIGGADRYLEKQAGRWLEENRCRAGEADPLSGKARWCLPARTLSEEEPVLQGYILRAALRGMGFPLRDITAGHIGDILSLTSKPTGKRVDLPRGITAAREYGNLILTAGGGETPGTGRGDPAVLFALSDIPEGGRLLLRDADPAASVFRLDVFPYENQEWIPKNQYTKWFDYDTIKNTLSIRHRRPGDYITLPSGGRKTVKSFLIDEKIPRDKREQILLLAEGSHVLWIVGFRISEAYKITEHTRMILRVQLDGGTSGG